MKNEQEECPEGLAKKMFFITISTLFLYVLSVVLFVL